MVPTGLDLDSRHDRIRWIRAPSHLARANAMTTPSKWAFVDYENVGTLEDLRLSDYERTFVFCGPKDKNVRLGTPPPSGFRRIELMVIGTSGANNLDFHLAFHLGRFHEIADETIAFHIISNDSGFNGLVRHLTSIGRSCRSVATKVANAAPVPKQNKAKGLSAEAAAVMSKLKAIDGRKRPRKKERLLNWMKAQNQGARVGASPDALYREFVSARLIVESESNITYDI